MPDTEKPSTPRPPELAGAEATPPDRDDFVAAELLWDYLRLGQPVRPAQWLLAFGSPDLPVAERAADLFLAGAADQVLVTGGARSVPSGSACATEAEAFAEVLYIRGVPEHAVAIEPLAANTSENFWLSAELLRDLGQDPKDFLVVHTPYAERRVAATARRRWPDKTVRVTSPTLSFGRYLDGPLSTHRVLSAIAGEVDRLDHYARAGLIHLDEPVPADLINAARQIRQAGFTDGAATGTPVAALDLKAAFAEGRTSHLLSATT